MAEFTVNRRFDPYKNSRFRVKWDSVYIPGIYMVSALARTTAVIVFREGGDPSAPRRSPGQTEFAPIILERAKTHDAAFEQWANKVFDLHNSTAAPESATQIVSLKDFRKDIVIELFNEAGQKVFAYNVFRCWVSEYQAVPELDAKGNAVLIEVLKLENEGWERDTSVVEPVEPSFTLPAS